MNSISMKIDGFDFSPYMVINKLNRPLYDVENKTISSDRYDGVKITSTKRKEKTISVEATLLSDQENGYMSVLEIEELIKSKLDDKQNKEIIFSDQPDRYFLGRLDSTATVDYITEGLGTLNLSFKVPSGFSRSINTNKFLFLDGTSTVLNAGRLETPLDINIEFTSDANSIGIVSADDVVQLGTSYSEDDENFIPSNKVLDNGMGSSSGWQANAGRIRWRYDSGDNTSKIMGGLTWKAADSMVVPSGYGSIDSSKPGYWHGPTISRLLTTSLQDFEVMHRLNFKPTGTAKQKPTCQGLVEINYMDADSNFVLGFEMKDNNNTVDEVKYSFFIGNNRMFEGVLPKSVMKDRGGFFGSIQMTKVGNKFTFKIARLVNEKNKWRETWSNTKTWYNEAVAMLSASSIQMFLSQWKAERAMDIQITHSRITKLNTQVESLIPKTFYSGDTLFVDGETNRVYINGIRDDSYRVIGSSQFLEAPKGESEYSVICDGTFTGYLEMRERY